MTSDEGSRGVFRRSAVAGCVAALVLALLIAVPALADFGDPGTDPSESPRINTPNDPDFDRCEGDDEDAPQEECGSYFEEQYGSFGFSPDSARDLTGQRTSYARTQPLIGDCPQLDEQGKEANRDAEAAPDPQVECYQLSGVRADTAWKYSTGDPETVIAILDTGIRWQTEELVEKVHLNTDELPEPAIGGPALIDDADCGAYLAPSARDDPYDANDDGAVNVRDYACDGQVEIDDGDTESDDLLDPSDLIARFSDNADDDGNGYADDIRRLGLLRRRQRPLRRLELL